ncbi:MAG: DedA family protein, partial [Campylobacteraceae bacterium]
MKEIFKKLQPYSGKILATIIIVFFLFIIYKLYHAPVQGFESKFIYLLNKYGYVILFSWFMMEGEMAIIMGGILSHTGDMYLPLAV